MFVDLTKEYNHKMLYKDSHDFQIAPNENFGICDNYILKKDFCAICGEFEKLPDSSFDNIICEEQQILVGTKGGLINFTGFAEWGDFAEEISVVLKQGTIKIPLFFYEWHVVPKERWNVEVVDSACTLVGRVKTSLNETISIFQYSVNLKNEIYIMSLKLPHNPAIHIFSIEIL